MISTFFMARRLRNGVLLLTALIVTFALAWAYGVTLHQVPYATGWGLFIMVVFLTFFNLRKKLSFLPLMPAAVWMQFHAYGGIFTLVLFLLHTDGSLPTGRFETILWGMFMIVGVSGLIGLAINRIIPIRQQQRGEPVFRDRMGLFRSQLASEVETLILNTMEETQTRTLSKLYTARLSPFFAAPRNLFEHLLGQRGGIDKLLQDMDSADRYLDNKARETLAQIREKVLQKDGLDFQYAHLTLLRAWLFVHIPATYSLLLLSVLHLSLVYGYRLGTS